MSKTLRSIKIKGNSFSFHPCLVEASTWAGTYNPYISVSFSLLPRLKAVPHIFGFCYGSNYSCITTKNSMVPTCKHLLFKWLCIGWGPGISAARRLAGWVPAQQVRSLSAPCVFILGPVLKGQQLSKRCSYSGYGRDTRGKVKSISTFQTPACVISVNSPFAKASRVAKAEVSEGMR